MGTLAKNHEWDILKYGPVVVERDLANYIHIMIWCQAELTGRFRDTASISDNMTVSYYFENLDDVLLFKLTWDTKSC